MRSPIEMLMSIVMTLVILVFFVITFATIGVYQLILAIFG